MSFLLLTASFLRRWEWNIVEHSFSSITVNQLLSKLFSVPHQLYILFANACSMLMLSICFTARKYNHCCHRDYWSYLQTSVLVSILILLEAFHSCLTDRTDQSKIGCQVQSNFLFLFYFSNVNFGLFTEIVFL